MPMARQSQYNRWVQHPTPGPVPLSSTAPLLIIPPFVTFLDVPLVGLFQARRSRVGPHCSIQALMNNWPGLR